MNKIYKSLQSLFMRYLLALNIIREKKFSKSPQIIFFTYFNSHVEKGMFLKYVEK